MSSVKAGVFAGVIVVCGSVVSTLPQTTTVEVAFSSGRVTVNAVDVPAADVLRAWGDVGQAQVTGIENLGRRHITLHLSNAPEETALTTIVGERSWFSATARGFSGVSESTFGRIDILPAARSADVIGSIPEQHYQYPETSITPEAAGWAGQSSIPASATTAQQQAYPETIYDYPTPGARFGNAFKILPAPNASNEQPIIQPGADAPVPEKIYEYPATPQTPEWMKPATPVPDLPFADGFVDGVLPGAPVGLNGNQQNRDRRIQYLQRI